MIRPMIVADLPTILVIEQACFPDPWTEQMFADCLANPAVHGLLVEIDAVIAGYLLVGIAADEGEILNVAVAPAHRRSGIGSRLLNAAIDRCTASGISTIFLETRASNTSAQQFYVRHGFQAVGRRRGYYRMPREDAIIMRREIRRAGE